MSAPGSSNSSSSSTTTIDPTLQRIENEAIRAALPHGLLVQEAVRPRSEAAAGLVPHDHQLGVLGRQGSSAADSVLSADPVLTQCC